MSFVRIRTISGRLLLATTIAVLLSLTVFAAVAVRFVSQQTQSQVDNNLLSLVEAEGLKIHEFFMSRAQIPYTLFTSPDFLDFFTNYKDRRSDLSQNREYLRLVEHLKRLVANTPSLKSVFFATPVTGEYFAETGRRDKDPGYQVTKRPWWQEVVKLGRDRVSNPDLDVFDLSVNSSIHVIVNKPDGSLLGIGGVDVQVSDIGRDILSKIKYEGVGEAFLITDTGILIFFPDKKPDDLAKGVLLSSLDGEESSGFATLQAAMQAKNQGVQNIVWNGEEQRVAFQAISSDKPLMRWTLGLMVPSSVIEAPIRQATFGTWLAVLFATLVILTVVYFVARSLLKPLGGMVEAMHGIARGEGDLTQRISIKRQDELGELAEEFNHFVSQIQKLVTQTKATTEEVLEVAGGIKGLSGDTYRRTAEQTDEVELVATAVTEMTQTIEHISRGAAATSESADDADQRVREGQNVVNAAAGTITQLSQGVIGAGQVITQLRLDADRITEVLNVIKAIAQQTNLLALNAAIEAARAGEHGRGFAVVSDEVRTLASRTQSSIENIQSIIKSLQDSVGNAEQAMTVSCVQAEQSVTQTSQVTTVLSTITEAVAKIRQRAEEIATATAQQVSVSEDINEKIERINQRASGNTIASSEMTERAAGLAEQVGELARMMGRFKV